MTRELAFWLARPVAYEAGQRQDRPVRVRIDDENTRLCGYMIGPRARRVSAQ